jgi:hypothetical protein
VRNRGWLWFAAAVGAAGAGAAGLARGIARTRFNESAQADVTVASPTPLRPVLTGVSPVQSTQPARRPPEAGCSEPEPAPAAGQGRIVEVTAPAQEERDAGLQILRDEIGVEDLTAVFAAIDADPVHIGFAAHVHTGAAIDGSPVAVKIFWAAGGSASPAAAQAVSQNYFRDLYYEHPFFVVPSVHDALCTPRVLVTDWVYGVSLETVLALPGEERDDLAEKLFRFVVGSMNRYAVTSGVPEPGDYVFTADGRVAFVDFARVERFPVEAVRTVQLVARALIEDDPKALRGALFDAGCSRRRLPGKDAALIEYFSAIYAPLLYDTESKFTPQWVDDCGRRLDAEPGVSLPAEVRRILEVHAGLGAVLARLDAKANWHRIAREYWFGEPPSTSLGRLAAAYRYERLLRERDRAQTAANEQPQVRSEIPA